MIQKLSRKIICALFGKIRKIKKELSEAKKMIKKMWKEIDYLKFSSDQYYKNWKECAGTLWNARKYVGELEKIVEDYRNGEEEPIDLDKISKIEKQLEQNKNVEGKKE